MGAYIVNPLFDLVSFEGPDKPGDGAVTLDATEPLPGFEDGGTERAEPPEERSVILFLEGFHL